MKRMAVDPAALDLGYLGSFLGLRIDELVLAELHAAGFAGIRTSHGYVFQHLVEEPRAITELAERMEVTQQAASKVVAELVELGVVELRPGSDRRSKLVALSTSGTACVAKARAARAKIAAKIDRKCGRDVAIAKRVLADALELVGGVPNVRARRVRPAT